MASKCEICGRSASVGNTVIRHGRPKKEGGIGLNVTGVSKRRWLPNIQRVRANINGTHRRVNVCTRCIKAGKITRA